MAHGLSKIYPVTFASNSSISNEVIVNRTYGNMYFVISGASGAEFTIYGAMTSGGTYYKVQHPVLNASAAGANDFLIPSTSTGVLVLIPKSCPRCLKPLSRPTLPSRVYMVVPGWAWSLPAVW